MTERPDESRNPAGDGSFHDEKTDQPSNDASDIFADFLTLIEPSVLDILDIASVLTEEVELVPITTEYPQVNDMYRISGTELPDFLRKEVSAIYIFVYKIYKFVSAKRKIMDVPIPNIHYSADIRVQITFKKSKQQRRSMTIEVGDIFPMALFKNLPSDLTVMPIFRVKSIEHNSIVLVPVRNPEAAPSERDS